MPVGLLLGQYMPLAWPLRQWPHQPIEEGGNGDFRFRPPTSNLSLERWVETRVVGWDGADVAD